MDRLGVWGAAVIVSTVLFMACGGGGNEARDRAAPATTTTVTEVEGAASTTAPVEDIEMTAADLPNIHALTPVGNHYVGNLLGHLDAALAVANSPDGGVYPVGTIIQLVPQEAMVKHAPGWNPASRDWEFFSLDTTAAGATILTRGATSVVNRFGQECLSCHGKSEQQWDMVCDEAHGCDPLGLSPELIRALQENDPRP